LPCWLVPVFDDDRLARHCPLIRWNIAGEPWLLGHWISTLQVSIVDARQLAGASKIMVRLEPHQICTIDSSIAK